MGISKLLSNVGSSKLFISVKFLFQNFSKLSSLQFCVFYWVLLKSVSDSWYGQSYDIFESACFRRSICIFCMTEKQCSLCHNWIPVVMNGILGSNYFRGIIYFLVDHCCLEFSSWVQRNEFYRSFEFRKSKRSKVCKM